MKGTFSKWRHVFSGKPKPDECYTGLRISSSINDSSGLCAANEKYFAVSWQAGGGGKLGVFDIDKPGRLNVEGHFLTGHAGPILDWAFHPFASNLIATASEDATVRLWTIPEGGMNGDITEASITLKGHSKKITLFNFHHCATHVGYSASMDNTLKFWDIEKGEKQSFSNTSQIMSASMNIDGSCLALTNKTKQIQLYDTRENKATVTINGHGSTKTQKVIWAKRRNQIVSTGSSKLQERQLFVWDPRKLDDKPLFQKDLDSGSGVLMSFYDEDLNILYVAGKGDGNIRYYELWDQDPCVVALAEYATGTPQKGLGMLPKSALSTTECEVARFLKLENDKISPISFRCPRKEASMVFQEDVYPDTFSAEPSLTADEYFAFNFKEPKTMSMKPGEGTAASGGFAPSSSAPTSLADIEGQKKKIADIKQQIESLQAQLTKEEAALAEFEGQEKQKEAAPAAAVATPEPAKPAAAEKPAEAKPAEAKPAEVEPVEDKPAEPAEEKPAETPAEASEPAQEEAKEE